ncbi:hypothetical protein D3C73_1260540 [compost metagenome]
MQRQRQAQGGGDGLTGMVVGRAADAATRKHHVARGEAAPIRGHQGVAVVGQELGPAQLHAARAEQLDDFGKMFVLTTAREDFIPDDDEANATGGGFCGHVQFQKVRKVAIRRR